MVPLTDGVGTDPWSMDIVGVTPTDVVVTETNPTNLTLGTRVGPVLAVPRDGSPARVLDLPPGRLLVAGTVVPVAPKVTAAPRSVTVKAGKVAVFTATASANPGAKVRWQYSADRGLHWRSLASTTGSLRVGALRSRNGWRVRAVFANAYGTAVTTAAVLRVS